mmetsp:Transcript_45839/g.68209  ORF Transcript_45839/g.68209 Transcript_45839/m.68209 type:complete len:162 (-) Transcript_45839:230-715(-)
MTTAVVARNSAAVSNLVKTAIQRCTQQSKKCVHTRPTVVYKGPHRVESMSTPFHSAALDVSNFGPYEGHQEQHHVQMNMSPKPADCQGSSAPAGISNHFYDEDYDEHESHMTPSHVSKHKCCEADTVYLSHHSLTDPRPGWEAESTANEAYHDDDGMEEAY